MMAFRRLHAFDASAEKGVDGGGQRGRHAQRLFGGFSSASIPASRMSFRAWSI
jgi:hypothetical protein